jgi:hypothetical protein
MSETTKAGLLSLGAAGILGLAGNLLLRETPWGLGAFFWMSLLVGSCFWIVRRSGLQLASQAAGLLMTAVLFAAGMAWRDSAILHALNFMAVVICLGLAAAAGRVDLRTTGVTQYLTGWLMAALSSLGGFFLLLGHDVKWEQMPRGRWSGSLASTLRGLIIAVPLLLLFGLLFMNADPVFAEMIGGLFEIGLYDLPSHLFLTALWAWLAGGYLRTVLLRASSVMPLAGDRSPSLKLGAIEISVVFGLLNALFLLFVLVQFRYFFGGASLVEMTAAMTYADYARSGFFELVGVTALVLPLLMVGHWLAPKEHPGQVRLFRLLSGLLLGQLVVIMASAAQRMYLYQQEFGLTEQRLYVSVFMVWLAILFVWFGATVLRGRRDRFAFGALVSGFAILALLHVVNPDALIARTNMNRLGDGHRFDAHYLTRLHAEAVPAIVAGLPQFPPSDRQAIAEVLLQRWSRPMLQADWRTWNWGRMQAYRVVEAHREQLEALVR